MVRNIILTEIDKLSKEFKEILEFLRKIITNKNILLRGSLWKIINL